MKTVKLSNLNVGDIFMFKDVIQELRNLFRVTNRGFSSEIDGIFFIDKRQYSASEVHMKLEMYFN